MGEHVLVELALALVLIAAAGLLSARIKFSIVPLIIIAGIIVGPQAPHFGILDFRFIQSAELIDFLGRLGIIFLLFYLGLEFSLGRLVKSGRNIIMGSTIYMVINFTLGLIFPLVLGWPVKEVLVVAGIMTISSSAIVAKMIVDLKRTVRPETEMIMGLMMFQDVFVAIYLSIVSGLILTGTTSAIQVISSASIALGFIVIFVLVGRKCLRRINQLLSIPSDEVFMLVLFAMMVLVAGLADSINVAEAIGALLIGLVLGESEHFERIQRLVVPFRDFFGALFFFSFGLSIDPTALGGALWPALAAVGITLAGNFVAGILAGRKAGYSYRASTNIGLTITSRGEFSILLASLAKSGGLLPVIQPFAALYVLILAILGPLLTKESPLIYKKLAVLFRWPQVKEMSKKNHKKKHKETRQAEH